MWPSGISAIDLQSVSNQSIVKHRLMVRWVIGSIPHGGPIEISLISANTPQLCGMCYPGFRIVQIKEHLLLIAQNFLY